MTLRVCEHCGKKYRPLRGNQKLCAVCKGYRPPKEVYHRICDICGTPFDTTVYNKKCCTNLCTQEKHRDHSHDIEKICPVCGEKFITGNSKKVHCSHTCAKVTKAAYDKQWRENNPLIGEDLDA